MKLKAWLKEKKVTQAKFAKTIKSDQPHVSDLVNGKVIPMLGLILKIDAATKGKVSFGDWGKR